MSLLIEVTRSGLSESTHAVHAAVVDTQGRLVAHSGDPLRVTWWRSSAKPFQALPLLKDGAADRFGFTPEMLALSCASHSSEPRHLAVVDAMLERIGCTEADLACGPHPPLNPEVASGLVREGRSPTPRWSNCSGKHAGMLAVARHHGWPLAGYQAAGHGVQLRILAEVARSTGLQPDQVRLGVDGCTAVCFALPLSSMAVAYARLATSSEPAERRLREAMWAHPQLVAGTGRLCTDLMAAAPREVLAKVGAEGVYGAAIPALGLGIALKVEDGDWNSTPVALLATLDQTLSRLDSPRRDRLDLTHRLAAWSRPGVLTTRAVAVGERRAVGELQFS